ncbi:unnamed protein product, partial [Iphiclides podalirius]
MKLKTVHEPFAVLREIKIKRYASTACVVSAMQRFRRMVRATGLLGNVPRSDGALWERVRWSGGMSLVCFGTTGLFTTLNTLSSLPIESLRVTT